MHAERGERRSSKKAIYLEMHPETAHGSDRKSDQVANSATRSFAQDTAGKTSQTDCQRVEQVADTLDSIAVEMGIPSHIDLLREGLETNPYLTVRLIDEESETDDSA